MSFFLCTSVHGVNKNLESVRISPRNRSILIRDLLCKKSWSAKVSECIDGLGVREKN